LIRSFASKETEQFFLSGFSGRMPPEICFRAEMRLRQLDAAKMVGDLRFPRSNRLEALSGDLTGRFSIRINQQWRITFQFKGGHAYEVEIVDYH
jgi:proteic killer suppression protein